MSNSHWILFTIVAGFTGFILGYSVPAMVEINVVNNTDEISIEKTDSVDDQNLSDYYKELQELK